MKTFTKIFAVTALLASASTATLAQVSVGGGVDAGVSVDAGNSGADVDASTGANASTSTDASGAANANSSSNGKINAAANATTGTDGGLNYGSVISELRTSSTTEADIQTLVSDDVEVTVVTLSELRGNAGENAGALDAAVSAQATALADLRTAIEKNSTLNAEVEAALSAEGDYTIDDVVSISTSADGQLILIVDDAA